MSELALYIANPATLGEQQRLMDSGNLSDWAWAADTLPLERGAFEAALEALLPGDERKAQRLYLGNEFCPYLAWTPDELLEAVERAQSTGFAITLMFCPQWERTLDHSLDIVVRLQRAHPNLEVVANDWGFLTALAELPVTAVAGRLLYKAKRNPRLSRETLPAGLPDTADGPETVLQRQLGQWALLPSDAPWLANWLLRAAATRVEIELVPQGLRCDADNSLPISLHLPWTYITGGGQCPVAALRTVKGITSCARGCRSTIVEATYPTRTWPLRQCGHTVFSPMISLLKGYRGIPRIDRWVLSPGLPM